MRATKERILEAKLQIKKIRKAGDGRKKRKRKLEVILPQVIVAVVAEGNCVISLYIIIILIKFRTTVHDNGD